MPSGVHVLVVAVVIALLACCVRAPPRTSPSRIERHAAIALARAALRVARGVEAPRSIAARVEDDRACDGDVDRRVRCHLERADAVVVAVRVEGGWRVSFWLPQLSDHVHQVLVRERRGRLEIEVDSAN